MGIDWESLLSEQVMRGMGLSPKASQRMDVTLDRMLAVNRPDTHMLDLNPNLMQCLLGKACEYDFGGLAAMLKAPELGEGALLGAMLRWQGLQGKRRGRNSWPFRLTMVKPN